MNLLIPALVSALSAVSALAAPAAVSDEPRSAALTSVAGSGSPASGPRTGVAARRSGGDKAASAGEPDQRSEMDIRGRGIWPLGTHPDVVHGFAPPATTWGAGHRGVDLAGTVGTPVRAALAGRITFASRLAGRGVVVIDHGETRTTYEPVTPLVAEGDFVGRAMPIGVLQTGGHCVPDACLHWGWIRNSDDVYLDPLELVGASGPVRLWPWAGRPAA